MKKGKQTMYVRYQSGLKINTKTLKDLKFSFFTHKLKASHEMLEINYII